MTTRSKDGARQPKILNLDTKHPLLQCDVTMAATDPTITCVTTVSRDPKWCAAMSDEINALIQNGTWKL